jgi:hypothetical protein
MPRQTTQRTTPATTTRKAPAKRNGTNGPTRKANGRNGSKKIAFHGIELLDGYNAIDAVLNGDGDKLFGFVACGTCAAILLDADSAKEAHVQWHEAINGLDQRAG